MTKPTVLLIGKVSHAQKEWEELCDVAYLKVFTSRSRDEFLARCASGDFSDVLVVFRAYNPSILFDAALIEALPNSIKFVCHNGAGYDQIDVAACTAHGIAVSNTPGVVNDATANVAMMLMLGALRQSWVAEAALREGRWRGGMKLGMDPNGKVLGILGMGGIGGAFAVRANGFGVRLVYHNRREVPDEDNPTGAEYIEDLQEFLMMSDIISVHLPLSDSTVHFLGEKEFGVMKKGVVIVNTARGAIIDEGALVKALDDGAVYSAGLDVFEEEPKVHPGLIANPNVVLYPHVGTSTWETQYKMEMLVIENVRSAIKKGNLVTQVPEQRKGNGPRL